MPRGTCGGCTEPAKSRLLPKQPKRVLFQRGARHISPIGLGFLRLRCCPHSQPFGVGCEPVCPSDAAAIDRSSPREKHSVRIGAVRVRTGGLNLPGYCAGSGAPWVWWRRDTRGGSMSSSLSYAFECRRRSCTIKPAACARRAGSALPICRQALSVGKLYRWLRHRSS